MYLADYIKQQTEDLVGKIEIKKLIHSKLT
jgi:hypothetical protein